MFELKFALITIHMLFLFNVMILRAMFQRGGNNFGEDCIFALF